MSWDETQIDKDLQERGVLYGTQKIDDMPTPFLLYESQMSRAEHAIVEISEGHKKAHVDITELQARLGMLQASLEQAWEAVDGPATEELRRSRGEEPRVRRGECSAGAAMAFRAKVGAQANAESDEEPGEEPVEDRKGVKGRTCAEAGP